jgi:hypothetical protein
MKNRDAQIVHLRRHVSRYIVLGDARPGTSPISIHWKRAKSEHISDYKTHLRHVLMVHVTDLIPGWAPMALIRDVPKVACLPLLRNMRRALS